AWNTGTATSGTHTLTAVARDAAGNTTTSAPVTVTVGTGGTPPPGPGPAVSITMPGNPAWTGNSLHVMATATSGGAPIATIKLYGNGGVFPYATLFRSSCTLDDWWNTGPLPNGGYQIQAVATDTAGAQTISSAV